MEMSIADRLVYKESLDFDFTYTEILPIPYHEVNERFNHPFNLYFLFLDIPYYFFKSISDQVTELQFNLTVEGITDREIIETEILTPIIDGLYRTEKRFIEIHKIYINNIQNENQNNKTRRIT